MKRIVLSFVVANSLLLAGGNIEPVTNTSVISEDQGNYYVGLGISAVYVRDEGVSMSLSSKAGQDRLGNLTLIGGYNYNSNFGFEGRYTTTLSMSDVVELESYGLFAKPQFSIDKDLAVYGLLGYGHVKIKNTDVDESGFQWGIGVSYALDNEIGLFLDYISLGKNMGNDSIKNNADAFTVGISYNF